MGIVIDKIEFENYRQYGTGALNFCSSNPHKLSVLIAQNGTGKTTVLNAITWCLYDTEYHLANESKALPLVTLAVLRNLPENTMVNVSVTVAITDDDTIIEFKRTVPFKVSKDSHGEPRYIKGKSKFTATVTPCGDFENTTVAEDADAEVIVKKYFDEAIFKFYFFDGEKLKDYFEAGQADSIQQSIFNISQISMLEKSCGRLKRMSGERNRRLGKSCPDIAALLAEREKVEKRLQAARETLADSKAELIELTRLREEQDEILRGYDPIKKLQTEREGLEKTLREIEAEEAALLANRAAFIREYTVLLTLYPRIKHTLDMIYAKEADGDLPPAIDTNQVRWLLDHLDEPCPMCNGTIGETGRAHLESLLTKYSVSTETSHFLKEIKGLLEEYRDKAQQFKAQLDLLKNREMDIHERKQKAEARLSQIAASLAGFESEEGKLNVQKAEADRADIIRRIEAANQSIGAANNTIGTNNGVLLKIEKDLADARKRITEHADIRKQLDVIDLVFQYFSSFKTRITNEMKNEIEATTWEIFDSMIWKKQTFGRVEIDDDYTIAVYSVDGIEMTGSLGATEQMALAYAFTLAIHRASGKNCPLVIDSPLGRVSDMNRENMAMALKKISQEKQIIMLFTPDEYSEAVQHIYAGAAEVRELKLSSNEDYVEGIDT